MAEIGTLINNFKEAFYSCNNDELLRIHNLFTELVESKQVKRRFLDFSEYIRFKSEIEYFDLCYHYMEIEDWVVVTESNNIKVESRGAGNEFFTKSTVIVKQNLFKALAVLSAADLVSEWVSVVKKTEIIIDPTMTRKLVKFYFWFPWPLSDRQCIIEFNAVPIPSKKACVITMRTPESENYLGEKIPPFAEGEVKMWVRIGTLYAEYVDEETTLIVFVVSADGNISFLPTSLINYGTKHIMYYMMEELRKKIENFEGSIFETHIKENPHLFDYIRECIDKYTHENT